MEEQNPLIDNDPEETAEWREALDDIIAVDGPERAQVVLSSVFDHAHHRGVRQEPRTQTPYYNTIAPAVDAQFPGDREMETRIRHIMRWNAMAMVTQANKKYSGLGGHMSTYASAATLYEVGFNHFFRGPDADGIGDFLYIQGHATPGIYARAFLEGRLTADQLGHFRRETGGKGLSSYPHPWLMPDFWQFPTVSMGLGPIGAIYQARFSRYLHARGIKDTSRSRVWAFLGDGECDEPETLGALSIAAREHLNNLTFVINCNLQRLDGPVRGNSKIIQELESVFHGAGWNVVKVIWGPEWDSLLAQDSEGLLAKRMMETVDGQYQKYSVSPGSYIRENFFGADPKLLQMVEHLSDADLKKLRRGGHSQRKVWAAYQAAMQSDKPTVILAKTVKGWELGDAFKASNTTHQMKKLDDAQLHHFRDVLGLPIPDSEVADAPFYHPGKNSPEVEYLMERRRELHGFLPQRRKTSPVVKSPEDKAYSEFFSGGKAGVEVSTTMAFVRLLRNLLRDKNIGKQVVPIIPDEARTFGMDAFFKEFGIYACDGQRYTPVDAEMFLHYHETKDGQLLEEGINEAGSMASFIAASTAHANHNVHTVPFYIFYSMFGFQRTGDQIWSLGDSRGRGFLLGATAGRTTLNGEGLQHEDGHSHLLATTVPNCLAYDPAYAFETAVIVRDGLRRMLEQNEDVFYYISLYNENYAMPPMPEGAEDGIIRGMYRFRAASGGKHAVQLFGSGPLLNYALEAQQILAERFDVAADVWSVTSYQQLFRDARKVERRNRLRPDKKPTLSYLAKALEGSSGPVVAVSDWVQELPTLLTPYIGRRMAILGTDGYGRSDTREALRDHFEIDTRWIVVTTLHTLMLEGAVPAKTVVAAMKEFGIDPEKIDPMGA